MVGIEETFDTSDMLPGLTDYTDDPKAYFFNPVFFENSCFGYAVLSYGCVPRSIDEMYRRWIKIVSQGLESLRRNIEIKNLR